MEIPWWNSISPRDRRMLSLGISKSIQWTRYIQQRCWFRIRRGGALTCSSLSPCSSKASLSDISAFVGAGRLSYASTHTVALPSSFKWCFSCKIRPWYGQRRASERILQCAVCVRTTLVTLTHKQSCLSVPRRWLPKFWKDRSPLNRCRILQSLLTILLLTITWIWILYSD